MSDIQTLGLHDPVFGSQMAFRSILKAMSTPGTCVTVPSDLGGAPDGLYPATAAVLLTLCDYETPVFFAHPISGVSDWVRFYTGALSVLNPLDAKFALLDGASSEHSFAEFHQGDDRYPDKSATLIIECMSFVDGPCIRLTGPGIKSEIEIAPSGLHKNFWKDMARNNAQFPLGVDVILTDGLELIALPRSVRIEEIA